MLHKDFLHASAQWACDTALQDESAKSQAERQFDLPRLLEQAQEPEKIAALFSEWLTFDFRHPVFGNKSGLECFVERNPLGLSEAQMSGYRDMLDFEVGLFEALRVEPGRGIVLRSVASGAEQFVHCLSPSWSVKAGDTVWTRIASVGGLYTSVGCLFFVLPVVLLSGMQETVKSWKRNSFDARYAASLGVDRGGNEREETEEDTPPSLAEAEKRFMSALKQCGMDGFFSLRTFKTWLTNEKKYNLAFSTRALFFLAPEGTTEEDGTALVKASVDFANRLPRKKLEGKSPLDFRESSSEHVEPKYQMDTYDRDTYATLNKEALQLMRKGEYERAYHAYEGIIQKLLDERTPFFPAFRAYANAAVCCFCAKGELEPLGEPLLDAALRINPLYDFALQMREYYVTAQNDFSALPKKDRNFAKMLRKVLQNLGASRYRRTSFRKYERFLSDCHISLSYKTKTVQTVWRTDEKGRNVKIGRNDPCYCNSGRKYKKCCGK